MTDRATVVITPIEAPAVEVRLHDKGDREFWASFNVGIREGGRRLVVSLLHVRRGRRAPGLDWFRANAIHYFPDAEHAVFARLRETGLEWSDPIPLKR